MASNLTHLALKDFLLAAIPSHLGTYTYPGGTMPAIALLPHPQLGYYFPPDTWNVTGIEAVVIRGVVSPTNSTQMSGGDLGVRYHWKLVLKQHDQKGDLFAAMDDLMVAAAQTYTIVPDMGGYVPPMKDGLVVASATLAIVDPVCMANV